MGSRVLNLDTHILLHALTGILEPHERRVLTEDEDWGVSAIVLWEIEKLYQKGRILYGLDHPALADALARLQLWPITVEVCRNLRSLDFQSDPADELIAATSLTHGVPLVTRDARIRVSKVIRCL
jgi:PIN domain nuclease of toxin-antitoxin system